MPQSHCNVLIIFKKSTKSCSLSLRAEGVTFHAAVLWWVKMPPGIPTCGKQPKPPKSGQSFWKFWTVERFFCLIIELKQLLLR